MAKNFIVLDVEGYSTCRPYDVGYLIGNKNAEIAAKRQFAIMPAIFDNLIYKCEKTMVSGLAAANEMAHRNIQEILNDVNGKYTKVYTEQEVFNSLLNDISEYNIKRIWAYNCAFDSSALGRLFSPEQRKILDNLVTFCDIIPAILHTKLLTHEYIEFCKKNGFMTEKGNVRTKAETVYRYLTNNLEFEESHTGLADVEIEYKILLTAMKETKNPKYKPCCAWREIQKFCEINGISIPALENNK